MRHATCRLVLTWLLLAAATAGASFVTFESGQVRPLALSPDGSRLFAVNTPDDRLEIFTLNAGLTKVGSVPVGLEPVAVAARTDGEVWVVNHLSDSVSVVDVASSPPRVVRTLLVGDEPRDIVFAGTRAFITTAHRGQNDPDDSELTTPGVGRADVWVFDALALGTSLGGDRLAKVTLFGDTPRALAVSPDGTTVYAAVFHSGNQTTAVSEGAVCNGGAVVGPCDVGGVTMPGGLPVPNANVEGIVGPETGLVVRVNPLTSHWEDGVGRSWDNAVRFWLPDEDVFAIDATADPPAEVASFAHVGTVLFNMAVNPVSGKVYVTNGEARNEVRFEGTGVIGTTVRGHLHEARITVLDGASVLPRRLNKHINYGVVPSPAGVRDKSLATPLGMAITSDGATLYVAAFGSSKIGVFDTAALEADTFVPSAANHITVSGGGPSGVVLDEPRGRLYALTRFDDGISAVSTATRTEVQHVRLHDPEPASVVAGRPFLYDAFHTSSNGEAACASCHVFADFDSLAWDLGDPNGVVTANPNPFLDLPGLPPPLNPTFHPMKGPMATQTLRSLDGDGPMHWRGDRTGASVQGGDAFDEGAGFRAFNVAFPGLLGRSGPLPASEMQAFTDFILQVTMPPNPIAPLDGSQTADQAAGLGLLAGRVTDGVANCGGCHGRVGFSTFEGEPQFFKVPQLRNMYEKIGMFGMPAVPFFNAGDNDFMGDQVRGFGFLHDGSVDTLFRFHRAGVFDLTDVERRQIEAALLAGNAPLAPVVGQQATLAADNAGDVGPRIDLLIARAAAGDCDLVVKGTLAGLARGWVRTAGGFRSDRAADPLVSDAALRAQAAVASQERTYTAVPPGSGIRLGIDRDEDGFLDRDELTAGSDPEDPNSPVAQTTTTTTTSTTTTTLPYAFIETTAMTLKETPTRQTITFRASTKKAAAANRIILPAPGSARDPRTATSYLTIYNPISHEAASVDLPQFQWKAIGTPTHFRGYQYKDSGTLRITLQADRLVIKGPLFGFTLNEPSQGRIGVFLQLAGTVPILYAEAPAKLKGRPPSTAATDHPGLFQAQPKSPPPTAGIP